MNVERLNQLLTGTGIRVVGTYNHAKASEAYVEVVITGANGIIIGEEAIPYQYRRTGLSLTTEEGVANYLSGIADYFDPDKVRRWTRSERKHWTDNYNAPTTTPFFEKLLSMKWVYGHEFPANPNPQRRIQDIKDKGYTVASKKEGSAWKRKLLPFPRGYAPGYETIPSQLRDRVLSVLNFENVYELSTANRQGLIPDHKFPEIRWDAETQQQNRPDMSEEDIRAKFQLLDNQRNQQKREVCRHCFQTGERGTLYGIDFFYEGSNLWRDDVPKTGVDAERGCIGCGWYDIRAWRDSLNNLIKRSED